MENTRQKFNQPKEFVMRAIGVLQKIIVLLAALLICGVSYARIESSGQMQMRWQAQELAKDVAALKKGDRGMGTPNPPSVTPRLPVPGVTVMGGRRMFLNFRPTLKGKDKVSHCHLVTGEEVELLVKVGKDVVARVVNAKNPNGDCAYVLMTGEEFVPLKRAYDDLARKTMELEKGTQDDLKRLKAARDVLAAEKR